VLRIGLTGGIGSGKSTVARRLVARGAVLIDSDVIAREVVAPGSDGLAAVVAEFGEGVLSARGELDRPALAAVVFGDEDARRRLNGIVHPLVRERSTAAVAAAPGDAVVVQDVPLLVEGGMVPSFPLVAVVHADAPERVRRLVHHRGMAEADARARVAAQATDDARRAAADVWLDNSGAPEALVAAVDELWDTRLVPFEENLRGGRPAPVPRGWADPDPTWDAQARRIIARVAAAGGERVAAVAHVGATAVPGLPAADVIELRVAVATESDRAVVGERLVAAGLVPVGPEVFHHRSADPGRAVDLQILQCRSPEWRGELAVRDWLRADVSARTEYCGLAECSSDPADVAGWVNQVRSRVDAWATSTRWCPSLT
jgi:dephospho-CoA kinase